MPAVQSPVHVRGFAHDPSHPPAPAADARTHAQAGDPAVQTAIAGISAALVRAGLPPLSDALETPGTSPYPAWMASASCAMSIGQSVRGVKGYPWTLPLVGFTAVFGGAGYAAMLDPINGPSIAAAWGILYMITCAGGAIRSRRPGPVALLGVVATSTGIYAREMLDLAD